IGNNRFAPDSNATRAMVVTMLWKLEGEKTGKPNTFTDVPSGIWYEKAVNWAAENSIVMGTTETTFSPDVAITREQLAAILYRYAEYAGLDRGTDGDLSRFPDAGKAHKYAKDALAWAVGAGLIGGVKSGEVDLLDPAGYATREQFAAIIGRYDEFEASAEEILTEADFYVSTRGNDDWNGSFSRPFRTLGRAILAVREIEKTPEKGGITVAVRAGEYYNFDWSLSWKDSGSAECPVTYKAYGDGPVTVHDAFTVGASEFTELTDKDKEMFSDAAASHVKRADISDRFPKNARPDSFFVTGERGRLDLCRNPNRYDDGEDRVILYCLDVESTSNLKIVNGLLSRYVSRYGSTEGMMLRGHFCYNRYADIFTVGTFDSENKLVTAADPTELTSYPWFGGFRYTLREDGTVDPDGTKTQIDALIVNMPVDLDFPGEYYVDGDSGVLYVYDPAGDYTLSLSDEYYNDEAEYVFYEGIEVDGMPVDDSPYEIPFVYVDKEDGDGFKVINISDPQLEDGEWNGEAGRIVTETVRELVRTEQPDLITISGDLAWGDSVGSVTNLADLLGSTGVPWAPVMGNHDHEADPETMILKTEILKSRDGCLFEWGDYRLGWGNYVVVLRQNGAPVHAFIMMDTHSYADRIDDTGDEFNGYDHLWPCQIEWYGEVCEKLKEMGVNESTVVTHIPCYTYREAWAAALLPGVNPYSVPAGDGNQTGCWSPGYEDSFGVSYDGEIASPDWDNGFFDAMLEHGSTKTMICGHDHMNCFSVNYRGIRLTYSLKTGPGCSWNPLNSGGTVVEISADGRASVRHHYVDVR
ncbi:MAG: S-layer homology domain-containing protein, partial [Clostridia bacterium]|nr:S-layer homology domain-containing protein [Clostridia bacterium]